MMEVTRTTALPNTRDGGKQSTLCPCQGFENCKGPHKQRAFGRAQELVATGISAGTSLMKQLPSVT